MFGDLIDFDQRRIVMVSKMLFSPQLESFRIVNLPAKVQNGGRAEGIK